MTMMVTTVLANQLFKQPTSAVHDSPVTLLSMSNPTYSRI